MKNGTQTVATMQPVRQMKNDICMPSVWQNYLIKDYPVTEKRGDVILWLLEICKDSPFNNLIDEVYGRWMTATE